MFQEASGLHFSPILLQNESGRDEGSPAGALAPPRQERRRPPGLCLSCRPAWIYRPASPCGSDDEMWPRRSAQETAARTRKTLPHLRELYIRGQCDGRVTQTAAVGLK